MKLQPRDEQILRTCYEQQFLLTEQIHRYFFGGRRAWSAYERISELEAAGLVKREKVITLNGKKLIRLTRAGLRIVQAQHPIEVPQAKSLDSATIRHDAIVTAVSLRLRQFWNAVWIPERALKSDEYPRIPDGVFVFDSGKKIAVEVENSPKFQRRFLAILESWRKVDVLLVLYVSTTPQIYRLIQSYLPNAPKTIPFGLIEWSALETGEPPFWSIRGELDLLKRREF
jgi:hypothetical protein